MRKPSGGGAGGPGSYQTGTVSIGAGSPNPNYNTNMQQPGLGEPRVSLVSVESSSALVDSIPSRHLAGGLGGAGGTSINSVRPGNEKAPLLSSQRRLFRGLAGFTNGLLSPDSSGRYTEFSSSGSINDMTLSSSVQSAGSMSNRTLTTFSGVFAPVTLSMFSALLFLRVGFIVGQSGLYETLAQFAIAYGILTFTVFSICAISTNGAIEGGGAYFMVSRTLGPEFGGAIGFLFIFANIVSSALYITGCVEGVVDNFGVGGYFAKSGGGIPIDRWSRFGYSSIINLLNLGVCLIGSSLFAKTSLAVLSIVGVSLMSVIASYFRDEIEVPVPEGNTLVNHSIIESFSFTGFNSTTFETNLYPHYGKDYTSKGEVDFAVVFGVLFSGVTGIMAGANMSGELKTPGKSIPRGTLSAVGFTFLIYILLSFLTSASCSNELLRGNYIFMMGINFWGPLVSIGILTATFFSSLSNLIGSSRVLEAVAKDDIFGSLLRFITRGTTEKGNPVMAVVVCWFIVQLFLLIGELNVIAQLNSVLFLLSYFAMNLACLGLDLSSAPNFRPTFKYFSSHTAFIGLMGCAIMMFVINSIYASLAIIACLVLVIFLHLFTPSRENWGSISQALIFHQVRKYLLLLDSRKDHVKFWRPHMLLFVANPRAACPLIDFVNDMKKSGLYVLGHVQTGDFDAMPVDPAQENYSKWLSLVDHLKVKAFIEMTVARSVREGMHHLMRISGLGAMRPNTVVLGFHDSNPPVDFFDGNEWSPNTYKTDRFKDTFHLRNPYDSRLTTEEYVEIIKDVIKMSKNLCLCRNMAQLDKQAVIKNSKMFIDVWPINFFSGDPNSLMDSTSLFLLQLGCILNMVSVWKSLTLRVFLCCTATSAESSANREAELKRMLHILRIKARIVVVPWDNTLARQLPSGFPDDQSTAMESAPQWPLSSIKDDYISSVNTMLREHGVSTAVTYVYLPEPPASSSEFGLYLSKLTMLSEGLGPSVFVHGISPVTSTTI